MKTLLLLRHAKSSWKDNELDDHDRPLNKRGKRDAPRMGELLRDEQMVPDFMLTSSAKRARRTAEHVAQACGFRGETRITSELYESNIDRQIAVISAVPKPAATVLLVGHNPGIEELLAAISGECPAITTAALAKIELPIESWRDLNLSVRGRFIRIWQPRELA